MAGDFLGTDSRSLTRSDEVARFSWLGDSWKEAEV